MRAYYYDLLSKYHHEISITAIYLTILASCAALIIAMPFMQQGLFLQLNDILPLITGETFWHVLTHFGDGFYLFPLAMILLYGHREKQFMLILTILLSLVVIYCAKTALSFPRPAAILSPDEFTIIGSTLTSFNSLPSGHTATAFILVGFCYYYQSRAIFLISLCFATGVGLSRIAVGAHWPADIVLGAVTGLFCAKLGLHLALRLYTQNNQSKQLIYIGLGAICTLTLASKAINNHSNDALLIVQTALCTIAAIYTAFEFKTIFGRTTPLSNISHQPSAKSVNNPLTHH